MDDIIFEHIMTRIQEKVDLVVDEKDDSEFSQGKALAYREVIDAINNTLDSYDLDPKKYGIDIDSEKAL